MERFRLLHVSDLHVGEGGFYSELAENRIRQMKTGLRDRFFKPASLPRLEALAQFAYRERDRIEVLVISGELATRGTEKALLTALAFVDGTPVNRWKGANAVPTLRGANRRIHLLPGNHDRFNEHAGAGALVFDRIFHDYWAAGQGCAHIEVQRESGESLILVFCDFTLACDDDASSFVAVWGQGRVYDSRVKG